MDVLQRLIPRHSTNNGTAGFKRLKHQAMSTQHSADNFFHTIQQNGTDFDEEQFALIPATDSPKVELALRPNSDRNGQKARTSENGNKMKMPWNSGEKTAKSDVKKADGQKGNEKNKNNKRVDGRDASLTPPEFGQKHPQNGGQSANCGRGRRTLMDKLLPGKKAAKGQLKGRLNVSASEPHLNFIGAEQQRPMVANPTWEDFNESISSWELEGDKHQLIGHGGGGQLQLCQLAIDSGEECQKMKTADGNVHVGAFQKIRNKLPGKRLNGSNAAKMDSTSNSSGFSSGNSPNSSTGSPSSSSSSSSSNSSIGQKANDGVGVGMCRSNTIHAIGELEGAEKKAKTPMLAKLRKQAKIIDIMGGKKADSGKAKSDLNGAVSNSVVKNSRKPTDAQRLLLFEEEC